MMPLAHMSSIYSLCFFILIPNVQKLTRFNGSGWWLDLIHVRVCTYMHAISVVVDGVRNWDRPMTGRCYGLIRIITIIAYIVLLRSSSSRLQSC
jgi:hypothetical protein